MRIPGEQKSTWDSQGFFQHFAEDLSKQSYFVKNGILRVYKHIVKTGPYIGGRRKQILIWDQKSNLYELSGSGDYPR